MVKNLASLIPAEEGPGAFLTLVVPPWDVTKAEVLTYLEWG